MTRINGWRSITWVGWLNIILFQWVFVRLYRSWGCGDEYGKVIAYGFFYPILPLTGWTTDFVPQRFSAMVIWARRRPGKRAS